MLTAPLQTKGDLVEMTMYPIGSITSPLSGGQKIRRNRIAATEMRHRLQKAIRESREILSLSPDGLSLYPEALTLSREALEQIEEYPVWKFYTNRTHDPQKSMIIRVARYSVTGDVVNAVCFVCTLHGYQITLMSLWELIPMDAWPSHYVPIIQKSHKAHVFLDPLGCFVDTTPLVMMH